MELRNNINSNSSVVFLCMFFLGVLGFRVRGSISFLLAFLGVIGHTREKGGERVEGRLK